MGERKNGERDWKSKNWLNRREIDREREGEGISENSNYKWRHGIRTIMNKCNAFRGINLSFHKIQYGLTFYFPVVGASKPLTKFHINFFLFSSIQFKINISYHENCCCFHTICMKKERKSLLDISLSKTNSGTKGISKLSNWVGK